MKIEELTKEDWDNIYWAMSNVWNIGKYFSFDEDIQKSINENREKVCKELDIYRE